jgi:phage shock protein PspC (stress-responsive transcriptional regulator)
MKETQVETATETQPKKLRRSSSDRLVAGVCGGLGDYFGLSPTVYRIAFVALSLAGGTGLLMYLAAALVIPAEGSDESIAAEALRDHRQKPWLVIGVALIALGGLFWLSGSHRGWFLGSGGAFWIAVGALIVWSQHTARERRVAGAPSRWWRVLASAVILAGAGAFGLLDLTGTVDVQWWIVLGVAAVLVGVLVSDALGYGLIGLLPALAIGVSAALVAVGFSFRGGVGDRTVQPSQVSELKRYDLGIGHLTVDLHDLALPAGDTRVKARVGIGRLDLYVPQGAAVKVDGRVTVGEADVFGRHDGGTSVRDEVTEAGSSGSASRLVIDAKVGVGNLEVHRGEP